jgi:hypothetical protein
VLGGQYAGRREEPWELSASRPAAGEPHTANGPTPVSSAGKEFIDKHIKPMSEDLEKKRALFMDDASFISEVGSLESFSLGSLSDMRQCAVSILPS